MTTKAVFLDRDGVVNASLVVDGKPYAPRRLEDLVIAPDIGTLQRLKVLGYLLIIVTNQPDVAHGIVPSEFVDEIHAQLRAAFPFDDILACLHASEDHCDCRKPKPGLLHRAQAQYGIDLTRSFMVGDRWRDVLAGQAAGCTTVFLDYGYHESSPPFHPNHVCRSLAEAIAWIESRSR